MKIVLASASPRRHELLKLVTENFEIRISDIDETIPENITTDMAAEYLSMKKASTVNHDDDEIVIGCDTVVVIDGNVLGKPSTEDECRKMLTMLSNKTHIVYTGVSLVCKDKKHSFTVATEVEFFPLSEKEISDYIITGEPFDKAGGYGIQGKGALLVKEIRGDYFNVVGLPVSTLKRELEKFLSE